MPILDLYPSSVHFSIKRYPIDELPADSTDQMGQWLNERWEEKEEKLKKFYKNDKKFHNSRQPYWDRRTLSIWVALIFWPVFRYFFSVIIDFYTIVIRVTNFRWQEKTIILFIVLLEN